MKSSFLIFLALFACSACSAFDPSPFAPDAAYREHVCLQHPSACGYGVPFVSPYPVSTPVKKSPESSLNGCKGINQGRSGLC
jgi:hypothetical protein